MPSCQVYIRGSKEGSEALGDTIHQLRDAVAAFLDTAEAQAIRNLRNDSPTELNDASPLTRTTVFTTVPTDLFRSVRWTPIHPAADSDPGNDNGFTRVSPRRLAHLCIG
jgi:hypothetical protein